MSIYPINQDRH